MKLRRYTVALSVGVLFGVGLAVSQMANPEKVLAFLNVAGDWDPSLLLVMAAAVSVAFVGFRIATKKAPIFEDEHQLPTKKQIDKPLVAGAVVFGLGWGIAGYCPGPAITGLSSGSMEPVIFVIAMILGTQAAGFLQSKGIL